jgi:hypothetical protein
MTSRRKFIQQSSLALTALALPFPLTAFLKYNKMTDNKNFDVIIIGGSYAGLSIVCPKFWTVPKLIIFGELDKKRDGKTQDD